MGGRRVVVFEDLFGEQARLAAAGPADTLIHHPIRCPNYSAGLHALSGAGYE